MVNSYISEPKFIYIYNSSFTHEVQLLHPLYKCFKDNVRFLK